MENIYKAAEDMAAGGSIDAGDLDYTIEELEQQAGGSTGGPHIDFSWIKTKTGPGSVDDYVDHPLNFSESRGVAQVLRGASGLVGSLDLAVIDIVIGAFNTARERKAVKDEKAAFNIE